MRDKNAAADRQLSEVLGEFARTMTTDFPIQAILDHLIERTVEILPITSAGATLISPGTNPHYVGASDASALVWEQLQTELGEGPCVLAYTSGRPVEVPDLRTEGRFPNFTRRALAEGMGAVFTFPLLSGKQRIGALDLYRDSPGPLTPQDLASSRTLADVAAAYLINAQVREQLKDALEHSRNLALHDGLTGLPNRTLMLERLDHAFQRSRRTGKTSAVIFVDLDGFKAINDNHGHGVGDQVLVAVATRLSRLLRSSDTVSRIHGDEFVILCEDLDTPQQATTIVTRLTEAMTEPFFLPSVQISVTASVGVAFADNDVHDSRQILREADTAMYLAKREGGASQQVFDRSLRYRAEHLEELERALHKAQSERQLFLMYQPMVNTVDGTITGFEALLRWNHPTLGLVPPTKFIRLAEQSNLINELGQWVLNQACRDSRDWQQLAPGNELGLAVNVSAQQLVVPSFPEIVADALHAQHTAPHLLTLEITENIFVRDSKRALAVLGRLKELGVRIAWDDFGTGYSSLSYLNCLPFDVIKVDRTVVANVGQDQVSEIIVNSVVQLAHALNMKVVAEGIETGEQRDRAIAMECDVGQGYYFARPMRASAVASLLHAGPGCSTPPLPRKFSRPADRCIST